CKMIWDEYNAFMKKNGRPEEARLYCHGQGYDLVERPLVRNDEPMPIQKNMNIVVHPTYVHRNIASWVCDNYMIEAGGPGGGVHPFPPKSRAIGVGPRDVGRVDYRPFIPRADQSKIAGATPRAHAQTRLKSPRAGDLFGTWAKLAAEPFKGITTDGNVVPGLFSLQPADAPVAQMIDAVRSL